MYLFRRHQTEQAKIILDKSFSSLPSTDRMKKKKTFIFKNIVSMIFF